MNVTEMATFFSVTMKVKNTSIPRRILHLIQEVFWSYEWGSLQNL